MVLQARNVREPDIRLFGTVFFRELQHFSACHFFFLQFSPGRPREVRLMELRAGLATRADGPALCGMGPIR
jgi:hypothetical protein